MSRIIVSGVGTGMGCSISRYLKNSGNEIGIISRSDKGRATAEEIGASYSRCDLMKQEDVVGSFKELSSEMGGLDGLVHLAGGFYSAKKPEDVDPEYFSKALTNNAVTFYNAVEAALPLFPQTGGAIVVISAARSVFMNSHLGYAAGKGAIDYMVRHLARELYQRNIRVNAVSPGFISKESCGEPELDKKLGSTGRHNARSVSEAVGMLLFNNITTGQILEVDAGFSTMLPGGLE